MFVKGKSGNPRGRPRGSKNRHSEAVIAAYHNVFNELGGEEWLRQLAEADAVEFARLHVRICAIEERRKEEAEERQDDIPSAAEVRRMIIETFGSNGPEDNEKGK